MTWGTTASRTRFGSAAGVCALLLFVQIGSSGADWHSPRASSAVKAAAAAVLWVGQGGSGSCVRAASPVGFAQALAGGNVCDSGPTAYVRARLGDTVLLAGGTYTSPWDFTPQMSKQGAAGSCDYNYGGQANLSGCVSFQPAPGQTVVFQVAGASAIRICANFVSIRGVTINQTTYTDQFGDTVSNGSMGVGAGDNSCLPGGAPPHDVYLANNSYGGQASALGGASNVWFVGGTATGTSDFPWQMGGQGNNGATAYANHNGIVGITFQGGNFANTDPGHHHMECVHDTPGSDHIVIAGSRFISCPVESFFAQGNSQTNILVENNYFINGGPLKFDCTSNNCVNSEIVVRYNSFAGASLELQNACNANGSCSGATIDNNLVSGNIGDGCPVVGFGIGGAAGSGWRSEYNVETVAAHGICVGDSTSIFRVPLGYVSPGAPNFDLRLLQGSAAMYAGDPTSHPARDIQGLLRPLHVAPSAGAAQNETAELDVGRSVGAVALGMSAGDVATTYGLQSPAATSVKPRTFHYRVYGRNVSIRYLRSVVVGIETTSPYYTTVTGLGVGSSAADAVAAGFSWNVECRKAYRRVQGGVATYLVPRGAKQGGAIASVLIVRLAQDECPKHGSG